VVGADADKLRFFINASIPPDSEPGSTGTWPATSRAPPQPTGTNTTRSGP
jgi:hypothetical protein